MKCIPRGNNERTGSGWEQKVEQFARHGRSGGAFGGAQHAGDMGNEVVVGTREASFSAAWIRQINADFSSDTAGVGRHHKNAARKKYGFSDGVSDEKSSPRLLLTNSEELFVEAFT